MRGAVGFVVFIGSAVGVGFRGVGSYRVVGVVGSERGVFGYRCFF